MSHKPTLTFNYDISCPFAYIASTRIRSLCTRTNTHLLYRPVLLGAIYRATSAPQGAAGSASDVFNPTKKIVGQASMSRTLKRYGIKYSPPPEHPRKSVNALRLLYCVEGDERRRLTEGLFEAYWVSGRDVTDTSVLLDVARECGISGLSEESFADVKARKELEDATAEAIERGAFGVPGFWIPDAKWRDFNGEERVGRFFWGQDRMHFVEATLLSLQTSSSWSSVSNLQALMPRCLALPAPKPPPTRTKLQFWCDFSSPWAFLGYTQLSRLRQQFPGLEIEMKPFLLGILFREIGAPNLPMAAVSPAKALWSRQDHADWVAWWNAVGGGSAKEINLHWADVFPIRTPTVLRVAIVEPATTDLLYSACWEHNENVSDEDVLRDILTTDGYDGAGLIARANAPGPKAKLRELTAEARALGICGVPTYRVLRENGASGWKNVGGLVWGQDETNVVEDLIAGWDPESLNATAEVRTSRDGNKVAARL